MGHAEPAPGDPSVPKGESPQLPGWVVVTRPEREAAVWVQALRAQGLQAVALPLMAFGPPSDPQALPGAWRLLPQLDALMFVSPQAVHAFWEAKPPEYFENFFHFTLDGKGKLATSSEVSASSMGFGALPCRPRFWAPGPGTAKALLQWGVPAECIDQPPATAPQFDSESLWPVVQPRLRPGMRVLLVRGESDAPPSTDAVQSAPTPHASVAAAAPGPDAIRFKPGNGRDWLMRQCEAAGVEVHACAAYRRQSPHWGPPQQALAQQALAQGAVWLLSSSESLGHLQHLMPAASWQGAAALATHPRIAQAAQAAGFARVWQSRPALADVAQALHAHLAAP